MLDAFRTTYPQHELQREATKQIAMVYRKAGQLSRSAEEYERVAAESEDPEMRAEALLLAGQLHEEAASPDRALAVYLRYVEQFPKPVEAAVETHFKIAEIYQRKSDTCSYHQLARTDRADRRGGGRRAHGAHALPRGALGARAGAAGLRELRFAASSCSRSSRASKRSSVA